MGHVEWEDDVGLKDDAGLDDDGEWVDDGDWEGDVRWEDDVGWEDDVECSKVLVLGWIVASVVTLVWVLVPVWEVLRTEYCAVVVVEFTWAWVDVVRSWIVVDSLATFSDEDVPLVVRESVTSCVLLGIEELVGTGEDSS